MRHDCVDVRVVKEVDSKSTGVSPRRFKSCSARHHVVVVFLDVFVTVVRSSLSHPGLAAGCHTFASLASCSPCWICMVVLALSIWKDTFLHVVAHGVAQDTLVGDGRTSN